MHTKCMLCISQRTWVWSYVFKRNIYWIWWIICYSSGSLSNFHTFSYNGCTGMYTSLVTLGVFIFWIWVIWIGMRWHLRVVLNFISLWLVIMSTFTYFLAKYIYVFLRKMVYSGFLTIFNWVICVIILKAILSAPYMFCTLDHINGLQKYFFSLHR